MELRFYQLFCLLPLLFSSRITSGRLFILFHNIHNQNGWYVQEVISSIACVRYLLALYSVNQLQTKDPCSKNSTKHYICCLLLNTLRPNSRLGLLSMENFFCIYTAYKAVNMISAHYAVR